MTKEEGVNCRKSGPLYEKPAFINVNFVFSSGKTISLSLIIAAPDLLEAAKHMLETPLGYGEKVQESLDLLRAAIAKAEGE